MSKPIYLFTFSLFFLSLYSFGHHGNVSTPSFVSLKDHTAGDSVLASNVTGNAITTITIQPGHTYTLKIQSNEESVVCTPFNRIWIELIISDAPIVELGSDTQESDHDDFDNFNDGPTVIYSSRQFSGRQDKTYAFTWTQDCKAILPTGQIYFRTYKDPLCGTVRTSDWANMSIPILGGQIATGRKLTPQFKCAEAPWDDIVPTFTKYQPSQNTTGISFSLDDFVTGPDTGGKEIKWFRYENGDISTQVADHITFGNQPFSPYDVVDNPDPEGTQAYAYELTDNCLNEKFARQTDGDVSVFDISRGLINYVRVPDIQDAVDEYINDNNLNNKFLYDINSPSIANDIICDSYFECRVRNFNYTTLNDFQIYNDLIGSINAPFVDNIDKFDVKFFCLNEQTNEYVEDEHMTISPSDPPYQRRVCYGDVVNSSNGYRDYRVVYTYNGRIGLLEPYPPVTNGQVTVECQFFVDIRVNALPVPAAVQDLPEDALAALNRAVAYEDLLASVLCNTIPELCMTLCDEIGQVGPVFDGILADPPGITDPNPDGVVDYIDRCIESGVVDLPSDDYKTITDPMIEYLLETEKLVYRWVDSDGAIISSGLHYPYPYEEITAPKMLFLEESIDNNPFITVHSVLVTNSCRDLPGQSNLEARTQMFLEHHAQMNVRIDFVLDRPSQELSDTKSAKLFTTQIKKQSVPTTLYPNPNDGRFKLKFGKTDPAYIKIYSIEGKLINEFTFKQDQNEFEMLNRLDSGTYMLFISYLNGSRESLKFTVK